MSTLRELWDSPTLAERARQVQRESMGDQVILRGIIEFSNYCSRRCQYCGIHADCSIERYRLSLDEILQAAATIQDSGISTVVLQSGEDAFFTDVMICDLVRRVRAETGLSVTLSIGERSPAAYRAFREAGADRFLLKVETTNPHLFAQLHPDDTLAHRMACSEAIQKSGMAAGSGCIIGLPGQTVDDILADISWFAQQRFHMVGIGPFVPAEHTLLADHPQGNPDWVLRAVALTRICMKTVRLPATTALESILENGQYEALRAGANVIMLNFTPQTKRQQYTIYSHKKTIALEAALAAIERAEMKVRPS